MTVLAESIVTEHGLVVPAHVLAPVPVTVQLVRAYPDAGVADMETEVPELYEAPALAVPTGTLIDGDIPINAAASLVLAVGIGVLVDHVLVNEL